MRGASLDGRESIRVEFNLRRAVVHNRRRSQRACWEIQSMGGGGAQGRWRAQVKNKKHG